MSGKIEVICGGMFSGKTEELIRRVRRVTFALQKVQVFKPALDNRYEGGTREVVSHGGDNFEATAVNSAGAILNLVEPDTAVVATDEAQFFDDTIVGVCEELADSGLRVIVAGLNLDALGRPFGSMPELLARADYITTLNAICVRCGAEASRTQLFENGRPAAWRKGPLILVGAEDVGYEARCRACHDVPGRPAREI